MSNGSARGTVAGALSVLLLAASSSSFAQERPTPALVPPPPPGNPTAAADDATTPVAVPAELLRIQPGGLTADQAGTRAMTTSWNARAAQETLRGAAARVDEAWASFLPRLSGVAKYTRLSNFTPPSLGSVVAPAGPVPSSGCGPDGVCAIPANTPLVAVPLTFPLVLDNWLLQATISVPISDYLFRTDQNYTAATRSQDAARWDVATAKATAQANGRIAFYTWLNARGSVIVAVEALNDQKTHLRDARNQFAVGNASKADVLRAETAVSSAELTLERAKNLADLSEKQLRVAMHARDDEPLVPGEDLEAPVAPVQGNVRQMATEALGARAEVRSAAANAAAAREQASAARAGRYPSVSAFADGIYANPNPRIFPQTNKWFPTWDLGAQLTWSVNDVIVAGGNVADIESRAASIIANENATRDNIEVEVTQTLQDVRVADFSIDSASRELASAQEAYRVARELFNNGRGTSTTLADAESDLTRARLDLLNSKVSARTARIRLEHALGRDVRAAQ